MANEKRLIDANAFLKALNEKPLDFLDVGGDFGYFDETIDSAVNEQPTVDAVEVVRCKDCKHCNDISAIPPIADSLKLVCTKGVNWRAVEPNHFCSYGERRTDGN